MNATNQIISTLILSILLSAGARGQTCPSGNLTLSSQTDINNFSSTYPNCNSISGVLSISGGDITNLNGLSGLTSVTSLEVGPNPSLTDISGLSGLNAVRDDIIFDSNPLLTNINALIGITSVSGRLHFSNNATLDNLDGLSSISSANILFITANPSINTISDYCGLWTLLQPAGSARLSGTSVISSNGLDATTSQIIALGSACPAAVAVVTSVPTMTEWSVIVLFLLLLIVTTVAIISYKKSTSTS